MITKNLKKKEKSKNPIINICLSSVYLYVAKSNGLISKYNLYSMTLKRKFKIEESIKSFGMSPFDTYLWRINNNDFLSIYNL